MEKLKVFQVVPTLGTGGAEKFVSDLMMNFSEDVEATLVVLYPRNGFFLEKALDDKKIKVIYLNKKKGMDLGLVKDLKKLIKEYKPDVINTHLYSLSYVALATRFMRHKPLIFHTVHNLADKELTKKKQKINNFCFHHLKVHPIGISKLITKSIEENYKLSNVDTIYNGIEYQKYYCDKVDDRDIHFIHVGRFSKQKNHVTLINAMRLVVDKYNDACLYLLGDGELKVECEELVNQLHLQENIKFLGNCNNVEYYLKKAKYFVLPSNYEGNPISLLEALAAGCVSIVTPVGGVPDIVSDNINGYYVENNPQDIALIMITALQNEEKRNKMLETNKDYIKKYDMKNVCEEYEKLYKKYLKRD